MFQIWKDEYAERCNMNQRLLMCDSYYNGKIAKTITSAWLEYMKSRRVKKSRKGIYFKPLIT